MLSARMDELRPPAASTKPRLRAVGQPAPTIYDSITRNSILRRIRFLRDAWGMHCLVDQATFNVPNIHCLDDLQLARLLHDMEQARECSLEGLDWAEAGLIRSVGHLVPLDAFD